MAALPEPRDRLDGSIFVGKPSRSAPTTLPKTAYQKIVREDKRCAGARDSLPAQDRMIGRRPAIRRRRRQRREPRSAFRFESVGS
jgi:hypothetical protein